MKKVSILMATYNGAAYIAAQLESIRLQTYRPHELWISDDGSTDDTLRIVSAFAERAGFPVRIRVNTQRVGYGENFLSATALCEGDLIAFCDQDDEWHPEKLERCIAAMEREDAILCAHTATLIDQNSQYVGYFAQGIVQTQTFAPLTLPPWQVFFGMTLVFRRELLSWIEPKDRGLDSDRPNTKLGHDRWVYFLAQSLGHVVTLSHPLVGYRQHGTNAYSGLRKSVWTRLRGKLVGSSDILDKRRTVALHRSKLMTTLAMERPNRPIAEKARAAAVYWRRQSDVYALRTALYQAPTFAERRVALNRLVNLGAYRGDGRGEFGNAVLAKDVVLGLFKVPLTWATPRGPESSEPGIRIEDKA